MDSSGSVSSNYDKEKQFIQMIAASFGVSRGGTHAGVVTFSTVAELSIKLSDTTDYNNFRNAVDGIRFMGGSTRIDLGLQMAKDELFAMANGGRLGVKKVRVLFLIVCFKTLCTTRTNWFITHDKCSS